MESPGKTYFTLCILAASLRTFKGSRKTANNSPDTKMLFSAEPQVYVTRSIPCSQTKGPFPWPKEATAELFWDEYFSQKESRAERSFHIPVDTRDTKMLRATRCCHQNDIYKIFLPLLWVCSCSAKRDPVNRWWTGNSFPLKIPKRLLKC